jgi:putative FmdB family regulatory protein
VPVYQYACTACGEQLEVRQSFTDDALTVCPVCEGRLRKVLSAVGVVFKGSGFYRTDSRAGSNGSGESGGSGGSGESGTASEPAAKSASNGSSGGSGGSDSSSSSSSDGSSTSSTTSSSSSSSKPAPAAAG